jgi:hypothetical protein
MSAARLASLLVASAAVPEKVVAQAQKRRALYGGALDTVLLEMGAVDEPALVAGLAKATGLPAAPPDKLAAPDPQAVIWMTADEARRLRAVPLGRDGGGGAQDRFLLAVHPEARAAAIDAWAQGRGAAVERVVVPEVRFRELLAVIYGEPVPARFSTLLGKLMGVERARRLAGGAGSGAIPPPLVDTGPRPDRPPPAEPDIDIVEESPPPPAAASAPARRPTERGPAPLVTPVDSAVAKREIPALLEKLGDRNPEVAVAAQAALINLARQDFGTSRRAWESWWKKAQKRHRAEWLLESLGHKRADLRLAASQELQAMTGVYFGYHFDLPERDREQARKRWAEWWHTVGKARLGGSDPP